MMSSLVMRQLEMTREVSQRQRAMKMGRALSSFVEGKLPAVRPQAQKQESLLPPKPTSGEPSKSTQGPRLSILKEESSMDSQDTISSGMRSTSSDDFEPEEGIDLTFSRAAYLIREALDVQGW
jgi:hypothetical protein